MKDTDKNVGNGLGPKGKGRGQDQHPAVVYDEKKLRPEDVYEHLLDEEIYNLTEEEIDHFSNEEVINKLTSYNIRTFNISARLKNLSLKDIEEDFQKTSHLQDEDEDGECGVVGNVPLIKFPSLVDHLVQAFDASFKWVSIYGPAYYGKSLFVREQVIKDPRIRARFPACSWIDFFALRMQSSRRLEREAVWKLFGREEESFHRFMYEIDSYQNDSVWPLREYIKKKYSDNPGIVVLDHVECLDNGEEVNKWFKNFIDFLQRRKINVIIIQREISIEKCRFSHRLPLCHYMKMPLVDFKDIEAWFKDPIFDEFRDIGVSARDVDRATGGLVGSVYNFGAYILNYPRAVKNNPNDTFKIFTKAHSKSYSGICDSIIQRAKRHPYLIDGIVDKLFSSNKKSANILDERMSEEVKEDLLKTGAFREYHGQLSFVCPALRRRMDRILRPQILAKAMFGGTMRWLLENEKSIPQEILMMAVRRVIIYQNKKIDSVKYLIMFLNKFIREAQIYVRDSSNSKLWFELRSSGASNESSPLRYKHAPGFAEAVQSGDIVVMGSHIHVPVVSYSGSVDVVLKGKTNSRFSRNEYARSIFLRRIVGMMRDLKEIISYIADHYATMREKRAFQELCLATQSVRGVGRSVDFDDLLKIAGCNAIVIFDRGDHSKWIVSSVYRVDSEEISFVIRKKFFEYEKMSKKMEKIANHPSDKGLVIDGERLRDIFPLLYEVEDETVMFLKPVSILLGQTYRVVGFVFNRDSNQSMKGIDGAQQSKLALLASYTAA